MSSEAPRFRCPKTQAAADRLVRAARARDAAMVRAAAPAQAVVSLGNWRFMAAGDARPEDTPE